MSDTMSLDALNSDDGNQGTTQPEANGKSDLKQAERDVQPVNPVASARKEPGSLNVNKTERLISMVSGSALIAYGLKRGGWTGISMLLTGGGLAFRGMTGHCSLYKALDINTNEHGDAATKGVHVEQSITIDKSPEELYNFWHNFENQPLIANHLESVKITGEKTSHWVAKGPGEKPIEWDAEVINDRPNELIAWKSMAGADIDNAGSVRFVPAPGGRGTEVHVTMQYYPPAGVIGAGIAKLMQREPSVEVAETLKRFKRLMETGEVVKTDGQPHGQSITRSTLSASS